MHVTGDRAIDTVVDTFVAADEAAPRPDARHYVIHGAPRFDSPRVFASLLDGERGGLRDLWGQTSDCQNAAGREE
ncbi:hypothetical protein [Streptomyces sp. T12]|uniref:hypothetical protein n=1 Tax=Streptomyces sp. T12 TaxID=477697 RepID=UPI0035A281D1